MEARRGTGFPVLTGSCLQPSVGAQNRTLATSLALSVGVTLFCEPCHGGLPYVGSPLLGVNTAVILAVVGSCSRVGA